MKLLSKQRKTFALRRSWFANAREQRTQNQDFTNLYPSSIKISNKKTYVS